MTKENDQTKGQNGLPPEEDGIHGIKPVSGMYENWFLDYASYVILERAVPTLSDGLKPVQRRILHSMFDMHDGRYHKVANIIGHTMQYHPHGDAAIGDALVNLGQKDLLIDTQGNWGDIRTGDSAAAPRYIEARLSKFAQEVAFNPKTTEWQISYDGRKKEPVNLPVKFPLLLAQGVEGIAVGLATKIMPHNFNELIKGSIDVLKGKTPKILPDFPTGGMADFTNYNQGVKGGKIRVRAKIESPDKKTLLIKDIPYATTTSGIIDSIVKANDNGKIKIKKVIDNTAKDVEIYIELPGGVSPDVTINALYAFTDCEVSISPNACVIIDDKPHFITVNEILKRSTDHTVELLKTELEIKQRELAEKWHFSSLEKIFIENRIYRDIEECETWEAVIEAIDKGLKPFKKQLKREVTEEDIVRLTEIRIKRISKYDSFKADEEIKKLEDDMAAVAHHLANLIEYAISWFEGLLEKFGKGRERKTQIRTFDSINASQVAAANAKLYVNREEGFIGTGLRKDELVCECSDLDDIIVIRRDGKMIITKLKDKTFVGNGILHVDVWKKGNDRLVYNMAYLDGGSGKTYVKRFSVTSITRDKEYELTKGTKRSKVLYLTANPNGETEVVAVNLSQGSKARIKVFDYDFKELAIKGRGSQGNTLTKYPVRKITQKEVGASTFGGKDIWFDKVVGRLNTEERGEFLGNFDTNDLILVIYKDGSYMQTSFELTNRYDPEEIQILQKFDPEMVLSAVHYDGGKKDYFVKRFRIETTTVGQRYTFIGEDKNAKMVIVSTHPDPSITFKHAHGKSGDKVEASLQLAAFIDVKGWKATGNKLNYRSLSHFKLIEPELPEVAEGDSAADAAEASSGDVAGDSHEGDTGEAGSPVSPSGDTGKDEDERGDTGKKEGGPPPAGGDSPESPPGDSGEREKSPSGDSGEREGGVDIGSTIEFDVKKDPKPKKGESGRLF